MKKIEDLWQYDISQDIIMGNIDILQREFNKGWNINEPLAKYAIEGQYTLPLMLAIKHSSMQSVVFLVEHGAMLDPDPDHAFIFAMRYADEETIRYVVQSGAKVKVSGGVLNAYDFINQCNSFENIEKKIPLAIELGLAIQPYGQHAFYREIKNSNYRVADLYIKYGIDLNYNKKTDWNSHGDTPLCQVACYGEKEMLEYLIRHGADPTIPNKSGKRPYVIALMVGKLENARFLKQYEANGEGLDERVIKKLPKDLYDFLEKGNLKVTLTDYYGIEYIEFFPLEDLAITNFDGRKGILLTREIENYPGLCLLWNTKKKCISYYEEEHRWYGDFGVSFQTFVEQAVRYIAAIFTGEFGEL